MCVTRPSELSVRVCVSGGCALVRFALITCICSALFGPLLHSCRVRATLAVSMPQRRGVKTAKVSQITMLKDVPKVGVKGEQVKVSKGCVIFTRLHNPYCFMSWFLFFFRFVSLHARLTHVLVWIWTVNPSGSYARNFLVPQSMAKLVSVGKSASSSGQVCVFELPMHICSRTLPSSQLLCSIVLHVCREGSLRGPRKN
jgi:hypothetical protein